MMPRPAYPNICTLEEQYLNRDQKHRTVQRIREIYDKNTHRNNMVKAYTYMYYTKESPYDSLAYFETLTTFQYAKHFLVLQ
jgi:hypothetical protein